MPTEPRYILVYRNVEDDFIWRGLVQRDWKHTLEAIRKLSYLPDMQVIKVELANE